MWYVQEAAQQTQFMQVYRQRRSTHVAVLIVAFEALTPEIKDYVL
jgi:hypothetical protein